MGTCEGVRGWPGAGWPGVSSVGRQILEISTLPRGLEPNGLGANPSSTTYWLALDR